MIDTVSRIKDLGKHLVRGDAPVLNPYLYDALQTRFGDVMIAKQGEGSDGHRVVDSSGARYKFTNAGEYYRANCPFCMRKNAVDTKHRLWIHHRWGVGLDEDDENCVDDKFWWACICYNEQCMEDRENVKTLQNWIYGGIGRERHAPKIKILEGTSTGASLGLTRWPGRCIRVDQLRPEHNACQYLLGRGFDPAVVGRDYWVSYCEAADVDFPLANARLIMPIHMNGQMVGWQARPPYDINWKATGQQKYLNCPGMNRRLMLYGFDNSKVLPFCIITEGVTDTWAIGAGAISLLGKSMSMQQADLIVATWKVAVIALDADAQDRVQAIRNLIRNKIPLIVITLPPGLDPADIEPDFFWDLVHMEATRQGVDLLSLGDNTQKEMRL